MRQIASHTNYHPEMQLKITTWTGSKQDGVLLAVSGLEMRVAIPGSDDAVKFCLRGGQWFSEEAELMEIQPYSAPEDDDFDWLVSIGDCPAGGRVGPNSPQSHDFVRVN